MQIGDPPPRKRCDHRSEQAQRITVSDINEGAERREPYADPIAAPYVARRIDGRWVFTEAIPPFLNVSAPASNFLIPILFKTVFKLKRHFQINNRPRQNYYRESKRYPLTAPAAIQPTFRRPS
jgi:hypothetical protein